MSQPLSEVAIVLNAADNVAIARQAIPAGARLVEGPQSFSARQDIPSGHKLARRAIPRGQPVLRYGQVIGFASSEIQPGDWVHTHNLQVGDMAREFEEQVAPPAPISSPQSKEAVKTAPERTFLGFQRQDGRVGTRNYIAVIATVSCATQTVHQIARYFTPEKLAAYPNVDGVIALVHSTGCCAPPPSHAYRYLQRTLLHTAGHPNVAAAIYVSLGCEGNQIQKDSQTLSASGPFADYLHPIPDEAVLTIQDLGGIRATARAGVAAVEQLLPTVNAIPRTPQPISALTLALQCGGSDGWSGVTANPLVGQVVDALVDAGGTAILAETPEIFGAEYLLTRRAAQPQVAHQLIERIRDWQEQGAREGFSLDNNPSPGNKAGGLTTIYEKSLGAVAKGGSRPLQAVYEYAERVTQRGLVFMDTPGYDPISVTGEVAGGGNLVLFTTGRGSVFGGVIAPCIKIASNSATYRRMEEDMDFDAGVLLEGSGFETAAHSLLDLVIETASGKRTKSEATLERESEFIPWQPGGIL
jgi:altronate dehydratase